MKAAQLTNYGGQDALQVTADAAKPAAGKGQVLVEVTAASLNPFDWKLREGYMKDMIPLQLPATLGSDVAGVVAEIGEGVSGFSVGQAVYGMAGATGGQGSYAAFTPVDATQLVPKPTSVDFITAAALPLAAVSAYQALVDEMQLQSGQKILIHGAGGGIGSLAVQLAKQRGAYVAATASAADAEFVKGLGADEVIDYHSQDFSQLLKDYDAVFDTVGGDITTKSYAVLKPGGSLVSMVTPLDEGNKALVQQRDIKYVHQFSKPTVDRLTAIAQLVDAGTLTVHIDKTFPLDQAPEALQYLKTAHPRGKVVLQVKI